ncbi:MAG: archease, partial [Thermoplasmatota archaeon]
MTYEQIEHTADVGIHAVGENLEEAFEEAARGLFSIMTDIDKVEKVGEYKVQVKADDWEALLVDFLSELVYLFEVKSVLFSDFDIS